MIFRLKKLIFKRISKTLLITSLIIFTGLNWFARQPQEFQQRLYRRLPQFALYRLYYLSNAAASLTDSLGITGHDSVADFSGRLPVRNLVVGGYPRTVTAGTAPGGRQYLLRTGFTICYAPDLRHPLWVAHQVSDSERLPETARPPFRSDPEALNSPRPNDYAKSGYDRGHMAPNHAISICYGAEAQRQSFLLSNICPQKPALNRGPWRKIEHSIADVWPSRYGNIWVITGACSAPEQKRLPSGIAIPEGFYKIIVSLRKNRLRVLALYLPQESGYNVFPRTRIVSVDEIEQRTGLDFLADLPDEIENPLEAELPTRLWPADLKGNLKLLIAHFSAPY